MLGQGRKECPDLCEIAGMEPEDKKKISGEQLGAALIGAIYPQSRKRHEWIFKKWIKWGKDILEDEERAAKMVAYLQSPLPPGIKLEPQEAEILGLAVKVAKGEEKLEEDQEEELP